MSDSASKMRFQAWPCVAVKIRHGENGRMHIHHDDTQLVWKFRDFCDRKGWHVEMHSGGPSSLTASIFIMTDDKGTLSVDLTAALKEIDEWMAEVGAANVCLTCGAGPDETHDAGKHER